SPFGGYRTYSSTGGGPNVFDLGDLFSQVFSNARGDRANATDAARWRSTATRRAEPERKIRASDGSWLHVAGTHVHPDVRVSFDRAILGTVAIVPTIEGKAQVKVPPGTSSRQKLRLRGKGITDRAGHNGDHFITVQIDVPTELDEDAKKQLVQFVTRLRKR